MEYQEFKEEVIKEMGKRFAGTGEAGTRRVRKNNGQGYDGLYIRGDGNTAPVLNLNSLYGEYRERGCSVSECVERAIKEWGKPGMLEEAEGLAGTAADWEKAREHVYPALLSTEANRELLAELASRPMLDLSVIYIIREEASGGMTASTRISRRMLEIYGVTADALHKQALENMGKEGYSITDMGFFLEDMLALEGVDPEGIKEAVCSGRESGKMFVLTNLTKCYGAAGLLNRGLIREFAAGEDYYILPSSIHECILVPVSEDLNCTAFDLMVEEINSVEVPAEERLADHCYYYDGRKDEIRMRP